jgi:hypothetical protein
MTSLGPMTRSKCAKRMLEEIEEEAATEAKRINVPKQQPPKWSGPVTRSAARPMAARPRSFLSPSASSSAIGACGATPAYIKSNRGCSLPPATAVIMNARGALTPITPPVSEIPGQTRTAVHPTFTAAAAQSIAAQRAARVEVVWQRSTSFMQALIASPLIMSALLSLEAKGSHPQDGKDGERNLAWTISSMLALHLRAGYAQATENILLAELWTLEAWDDVWRSPSSTVLPDHVKHLGFFDNSTAQAWDLDYNDRLRAQKKAASQAQMDLLKRLDWRVRLHFDDWINPCHDLLFGGSNCGASFNVRPDRDQWVARMQNACVQIKRKAGVVKDTVAKRISAAEYQHHHPYHHHHHHHQQQQQQQQVPQLHS